MKSLQENHRKIAPLHENNSWWECVGRSESVEKKIKNIKIAKCSKYWKIPGSHHLLVICQYFEHFANLDFLYFSQLILNALHTPTNYCFSYKVQKLLIQVVTKIIPHLFFSQCITRQQYHYFVTGFEGIPEKYENHSFKKKC